jgi:tRNA (Thr-GGU) A37 N-methylase
MNLSTTVITYRPIGVIRSEHVSPEKTPIQPAYAKGCKGEAHILPEFTDGRMTLTTSRRIREGGVDIAAG